MVDASKIDYINKLHCKSRIAIQLAMIEIKQHGNSVVMLAFGICCSPGVSRMPFDWKSKFRLSE